MFGNREIDLKRMILSVLLKWRIIVLAAVALAVVVPLCKYVKDARTINNSAAEKTVEVSDNNRELDDEPNVILLANLFKDFNFISNSVSKINDLDINPSNIEYAYALYYIKNYEKDTENNQMCKLEYGTDDTQNLVLVPDDMVMLYTNAIHRDEFVNSLLEASKSNVKSTSYKKYIVVESADNALCVKVPVLADMDRDKLLSELEKLIELNIEGYQQAKEHSLELMSEGFTIEENKDLLDDYYKWLYKQSVVGTNITSVEKSMTDAQIARAKEIAFGESDQKAKDSEGDADALTDGSVGDDQVVTDVKRVAKARFSTKFMLAGAVAGAFIMFCWYCIIYILSGKLSSLTEITKQAKLVLFETLEVPSAKKPFNVIDDMIRYYLNNNKRKLTKEQQIKAIVSSISLFAQQNDVKSVCMSSSLFGKDNDAIMKEIVDAVAADGISVRFVDDIAYDKDALRKSADSDGLILIEHIGQSLLSEIEKELNTAGEYKVRVLGAVVLE